MHSRYHRFAQIILFLWAQKTRSLLRNSFLSSGLEKTLLTHCEMSTSSSERESVIVGLNPALQRILQFSSSSLIIGEVNRAASVKIGIGKNTSVYLFTAY